MQLVVTEKPSVAQAISHVIGAKERKDGYMEGNGFLVSWCVGHSGRAGTAGDVFRSMEKMEL